MRSVRHRRVGSRRRRQASECGGGAAAIAQKYFQSLETLIRVYACARIYGRLFFPTYTSYICYKSMGNDGNERAKGPVLWDVSAFPKLFPSSRVRQSRQWAEEALDRPGGCVPKKPAECFPRRRLVCRSLLFNGNRPECPDSCNVPSESGIRFGQSVRSSESFQAAPCTWHGP